jgi:transposase-like protein
MANKNPFKYFKTSPEIIRLAVMFYVRYPLSYRQVEDILHERGIDICHETVRFWWNRFGPMYESCPQVLSCAKAIKENLDHPPLGAHVRSGAFLAISHS